MPRLRFTCTDIHDGTVRAMNLLRRTDIGIAPVTAERAGDGYVVTIGLEPADEELVARVARQIGQIVDVADVDLETERRRAA